MSNVTITDVRRVAARLGEMSRQLGLWEEGRANYCAVVLSEGSKTYGNAYRLNGMGLGSSRGNHLPKYMGRDYLGMTKSEAFDSLITRQNHLYDIADVKGFKFDHDTIDAIADKAEKTKRVDWSLWMDETPWSPQFKES